MAQGVKMLLGICLISWLYLYGLWLICIDTLFSSFPMTILGTLVLFVAYHYVKLPPPDPKLVDEFLGQDPWLIEDTEIMQNGEVRGEITVPEKKKEPFCMRIIAHRGAGLDAPENSLSAFRKCKERGCNAVEFDVTLTADGIPVIFHDRYVDRVTEATGELSSMTYEEVRKLDISTNHAFREWYKGERIPTLEEAVQECLSLGLKMFIDIKDNDTKIIPHILALYGVELKSQAEESILNSKQVNTAVWKPPQGTNMHSKAIVTSFYPYIIYLIRRADPRIICTLAWRPFFFSSESYSASSVLGLAGASGSLRRRYPGIMANLGARIADEVIGWCLQSALPFFILGLSGLLVHKDLLSPEQLRQWREKGVRIIAWTVNNPTEKHFFTKILKVTYITDTLDAESDHSIPLGLDLAATR